jgi:tripartite-type tricarboxylate transporter receptor subunit TctC
MGDEVRVTGAKASGPTGLLVNLLSPLFVTRGLRYVVGELECAFVGHFARRRGSHPQTSLGPLFRPSTRYRHPYSSLLASFAAILLAAAPAFGQQYPAKLVRVVTGSTAGGGADVTARQIVPRLAEALKVQMIVDNRPGVAGMIANDFVSKAAPDGYTLLVQPGSFMMVSGILNAKGGWDPTKSLAPVIQVGYYAFVLAVHPSVPAKSVKEFIAVARAKPGAISFVSTGVGSNFHLAGALFELQAKVKLWHVPYKGSPPAIVDLVAGRAEATFMQVPSLLPHINAGKLRALGVTGPRRNPLLPQVPPISDALPGYELTGTEWIMAPAGTPREILARLNAAVTAIFDQPDMKELWASKGVEFIPGTPEVFAEKFRKDYEKTAAAIRAAGVKPEF